MHSNNGGDLKGHIGSFLSYIETVRGYSKATVSTYEIALRQMGQSALILPIDGGWSIDLSPFRIAIANQSKKTIALKLSAVRSFVHYLQDQLQFKISLTYAQAIKVPKTLPKPIDAGYIMEVLEDSDLKTTVIITMLYGLGLRISELASLKLEGIRGDWVSVMGKGNKERQLPLIPMLRNLLTRYIQHSHPKYYLLEKKTQPLTTSQLRYTISKAFALRGIKATPHQLRHAFATHLLSQGGRISDISELLGHKSMASTQIYTKLEDKKKMESYMQAHPLAKRNG